MKGDKNPEGKASLVRHGRVAQLYSQSKHFRRATNEAQEAGGRRKLLKCLKANATRWTGRGKNEARNNDISYAVDDGLAAYRRGARAVGMGAVEFYHMGELEDDGATPQVNMQEIGFSEVGWEESCEMQAQGGHGHHGHAADGRRSRWRC